jgi:hypothetical protein
MDVHRVHPNRLNPAQVVEAAIASDPVEPRARVDRAIVRQHRVVGGGECLLQDILGILLRAEHVPAEREQPRVVAGHQRFEGRGVAATDQRDQSLVRLESEQRRAAKSHPSGVVES